MSIIINKLTTETVIDKIYDLAVDDSRFEDAADLSDGEIKLVFNIIFMAMGDSIAKLVKDGLPIHLNGIGKIKIKAANKIAVKHKDNIANRLGYDNFRQVPKDKLDDLQKEANLLTIAQIKSENKIKRRKSVKTARFNIINK